MTGDDVIRIREAAHAVGSEITQAFVVLNGNVQDDAWAHRAALRMQGFNLMPIPYTVLYDARTSTMPDVEPDVLAAHLERFLGTGKDPYDVRDPVYDSLDFFGREALADSLGAMLAEGKPVGVFGLRKMGKSSLLRYLQSRLPFPTARLDLQAGAEPGVLLQRAMRAWETDARARFRLSLSFGASDALDGTVSVDATVHAIRAVLDRQATRIPGRRLAILLDEIELLAPDVATPDSDVEPQLRLMRALRGLVQEDGRMSLLVVGVDPAIVRQSRWGMQEQQNPFFQFIREIHLGPLLPADCAQMIRIIGSQADLRCTEAASARVAEVSGGHPFLARQIASLAFKGRHYTAELSVDEVERAENIFLHDPMYASFLGELWNEATSKRLWGIPAARANEDILRTLAWADGAVPASELQRAGNDHLAALYELERRHVVCTTLAVPPDAAAAYAVSFGLLRRWIRRNLPQLGGA